MKNSVIKRVWAWLMVACMLFTMVPAFAEMADEGAEVVEAVATAEPEAVESEAEAPVDDGAAEAEETEAPAEPVESEEAAEPEETEAPEVEETPAPEVDEPAPEEPGIEDEDNGIEVVAAATATPEPFNDQTCSAGDNHVLDWDKDHQIVVAGDCDHDRLITGVCAKCGQSGTFNVGPGHTYDHYNAGGEGWRTSAWGNPPTCTTGGYLRQQCSVCGAYTPGEPNYNGDLGERAINYPSGLGHIFAHDKADEVPGLTCNDPITITTIYCTREGCDRGKSNGWTTAGSDGEPQAADFQLPAPGHVRGEPEHMEANCLYPERDVVKCTVCGTILESTNTPNGDPATGNHLYSVVKSTNHGTLTYEGPTAYTSGSEFKTDVLSGQAASFTHKRSCKYCGQEQPGAGVGQCNWYLASDTPGTCTRAQRQVWKCTLCDNTVEWTKDSMENHTDLQNRYVLSDKKTTAQHSDNGKMGFYVCDNCNAVYDSSNRSGAAATATVEIKTHTWGERELITKETCTEKGQYRVRCTVQGCTASQLLDEPALGHDWKWEVLPGATCLDAATGVLVCQTCGAEQTERITNIEGSKGEHQYDINAATTKIIREATCFVGAVVEAECTVCHTMVQVESEPLGHDWEKVTTTDNCKVTIKPAGEGGAHGYIIQCTRCHMIKSEPDDSGNEVSTNGVDYTADGHHDYNGDGVRDDSDDSTGWKSDNAGHHTRTCSFCGMTEDAACSAVPGDPIDATCISPKLTPTSCSTCGYTTYEEDADKTLDPTNHVGAQEGAVEGEDYTLRPWSIQPPTCTSRGYYEKVCKCGQVFGNLVSVASAHTYDAANDVILTEATCQHAGQVQHRCSICGHTEVEELPITGHQYEDATIPATCEYGTREGSFCKWCQRQNPFVQVTERDDKLEHQFDFDGDYVLQQKGTCTEDEIRVYTCTLCKKYLETVTIPATKTEHSGEIISRYVDATCTQPQRQEFYCSDCGALVESRPVANGTPALNTLEGNGNPDYANNHFVNSEKSTGFERHYLGKDWTFASYMAAHPGVKLDATHCGFTCPTCGETIVRNHGGDGTTGRVTSSTADCLYSSTNYTYCLVCREITADTSVKRIDPSQPHHKDLDGKTSVSYQVVSGNCETGVVYREICNYCGGRMSGLLGKPAGEHVWGEEGVITKAATCVEDGVRTFTCEICQATKTERIDKLSATGEHTGLPADDSSDWEITQEPTETTPGKKQAVCTTCGATVERDIPATGSATDPEHHNPHTIVEDDPDDTGIAFVTWCPVCGYIESFEFNPLTPEDQWDCTKITVTDSKGGEHHPEHYGPEGDQKETTTATEATCTKPGTSAGTKCTVCGQQVEGTTTPAKGHSWQRDGFDITIEANRTEENGWKVDTEAQPGVAGTGHYECTDPNCDAETKPAKSADVTIEALPKPADRYVKTTKLTVLRATASNTGAYVTTVPAGTQLKLRGELEGNFYPVEAPDGTACYANKGYVELVEK